MQFAERSKSVFEFLRTCIKVKINNFLYVRKRILLRTLINLLKGIYISGYMFIKDIELRERNPK
jgi:hypothetical protein